MAFQDRRRNVISASEKFPFSGSRLRRYYFHDLLWKIDFVVLAIWKLTVGRSWKQVLQSQSSLQMTVSLAGSLTTTPWETVNHNHLGNSWSTEIELTNACCFKSLSFVVICYATIDDRYKIPLINVSQCAWTITITCTVWHIFCFHSLMDLLVYTE